WNACPESQLWFRKGFHAWQGLALAWGLARLGDLSVSAPPVRLRFERQPAKLFQVAEPWSLRAFKDRNTSKSLALAVAFCLLQSDNACRRLFPLSRQVGLSIFVSLLFCRRTWLQHCKSALWNSSSSANSMSGENCL